MAENMQKCIESFKTFLFELEREFASDQYISTTKLIHLLDELSIFYRSVDTEFSKLRWTEYCSILANILTKWANSNAVVSADQLASLVKYKSLLSSIYLASHDSEQKVLMRNYDPKNDYNQNYTKVLLLVSINNITREVYRGYTAAPDKYALMLSIGWLSERSQMTKYAAVYHQKLVEDFQRFENLLIDLDYVSWLSKAYMYTTYSNSAGKDSIKGTIHKLISRSIHFHSEQGSLSFARSKIRSQPKVLIIHEYFSDSHVMMRCFIAILQKLDKEFDVHHLTWSTEEYSQTSSKLKNVHTCNDNLSDIIAAIREFQPDVIFYPSIGMNTLVISLASLRLAPIQLQAFGHPSSSNSPHIDGSLHNNLMGFTNSGCEKLTVYEGYREGMYMPFTLSKISKNIKSNKRTESGGLINIGINAKVMKLSPEFMIFLKRLNWQNESRLNFFPAETGTEYLGCCNLIQRYFPGAKVHHMTNYETFMRELSTQDLAICSFPFGNTNGILDCLHLGLPTFVLKGSQICSAPETQILTASGLGEYVFLTKEQMSEAINKFLVDAKFRRNVRKEFREKSRDYIKRNNLELAQEYEADNFSKWIEQSISDFRKQQPADVDANIFTQNSNNFIGSLQNF